MDSGSKVMQALYALLNVGFIGLAVVLRRLELDPVYGMAPAIPPPPCKRISYGEVFLSSCLRDHAKFIVFVASSEKLRLDESTSTL